MHSHCLFLLLFLPFFLTLASSQPRTPLKGLLLDCGATSPSNTNGLLWLPDNQFILTGTPKNITTSLKDPIFSSLRSFPLAIKKHCYDFLVIPGKRYLVRTMYFYGGVNGRRFGSPPVFDQIVDGTLWSVVNTTEDYASGKFSSYEGVFSAEVKVLSFCIGSNSYTVSDPFISAIELVLLSDSLYNVTDFSKFGLNLVARHSFGYSGPTIRYPDDSSDRFWEPFGVSNVTQAGSSDVSVSGFWNLPPLKIFQTHMGSDKLKSLELRWPPKSLQSSKFYISLYFASNKKSSFSGSGSRILNIGVNGISYYHGLNVTSDGVVVFARQWPLSGPTTITLTPTANSSLGPVINAGEIFDLVPLGGRTVTRDVVAINLVKGSLLNPPLDWIGDPCLPLQYSWTGITCSKGDRIRIKTLNLTGFGLSGYLSPNIVNMTALNNIWLGNNNLSGRIPDLSSLKFLKTLHLEDNIFSGEIPSSLGNISSLHEVFLQNNYLTGQVPSNLIGKPGLELQTYGNRFSSPPTP